MPTWAGVAYACFISDAFSPMIVGRRVAAPMPTTMVLDAIEMTAGHAETRPRAEVSTDPGSQFTSVRYGERLAEIGAGALHGIRRGQLR